MPDEPWYSIENLNKAWKYAKIDMRDDFVFDAIGHEDLKHNIDQALRTLSDQLQRDQYHPAPILSIEVPKSDHSFRPGTTIPVLDLVVLYAIAQWLAPPLDETLEDSVYAYRLNPKYEEKRQALFRDKESPEDELEQDANLEGEDDEGLEKVGFPYNWFQNWIAFDQDTQTAAEEFEHVAVTDITAFFENISLRILFDRLHELGEEYRELLDRLATLLDYWDWAASVDKAPGMGLPQGNDVSSFLSNIYLRDLDRAMLDVVKHETGKYYRYVDDIKLYTSNYDEACRALVALEGTLRKLGLHVQTAKTEIRPASQTHDPDVVEWMQYLSSDREDRVEHAHRFITQEFSPDKLGKWQRVYRRSLTVLGEDDNDAAVPVAFAMFLTNPSVKVLPSNFRYLRRFASGYLFEQEIRERLREDGFAFPYHRAYLYRLAAYSRAEDSGLRKLALAEAKDDSSHWFSGVGALLFLSTCRLSPGDLGYIGQVVLKEGNTQVLRAAYTALCQHSGTELQAVLSQVSFFSAPHQDHFRRYFFQLVSNYDRGQQVLAHIDRASIESPFLVERLHQLDLVKANSVLRSRFREVLEKKIEGCSDDWTRLKSRLQGIFDSFVESP